MMIASRTPEGEPNRCPVCGHTSEMEPSLDGRDAVCPDCGSWLWYGRGAPSERQDAGPLRCKPLTRDGAADLLAECALRNLAAARAKPVIRGLAVTRSELERAYGRHRI